MGPERPRRPRGKDDSSVMTETLRDHAPERTCVGCGKRSPADVLVRLVLDEVSGGVVPDAKGGSFGRGAHVHASPSCLELACKKGLPRAFKRDIKATPQALAGAIAEAFGRRLDGLLSGGKRSGSCSSGPTRCVKHGGTAARCSWSSRRMPWRPRRAARSSVRRVRGRPSSSVIACDSPQRSVDAAMPREKVLPCSR